MKEKWIVTIDGVDCTGKTTLWKKLDDDTPYQIRGIISNIAYAIKYGRDYNKLIENYNKYPINYYIFLLNVSSKAKTNYIKSRMNEINNYDALMTEIKSINDSEYDMNYFYKALSLLQADYKGKIMVYEADETLTPEVIAKELKHDDIELYEYDEINKLSTLAPEAIRVVAEDKEFFEVRAKIESEYKYIVFRNRINKQFEIETMLSFLDESYEEKFSTLLQLTSLGSNKIYDALNEKNADGLAEYLDSYMLSCTANATVTVETSCDFNVSLKEYCESNQYSLEDYVSSNNDIIDKLYEGLKEDVNNSDLGDLDVECED